jgi:hypothetical protein
VLLHQPHRRVLGGLLPSSPAPHPCASLAVDSCRRNETRTRQQT